MFLALALEEIYGNLWRELLYLVCDRYNVLYRLQASFP